MKKLKDLFMNSKIQKKIVVILLVLISVAVFVLSTSTKPTKVAENVIDYEKIPEEKKEVIDYIDKEQESYKEINEDYVGTLVFESNLINTPVVQALSFTRKSGSSYSFYSDQGVFLNSFNAKEPGACDGRDCNPNDVYTRMDWQTMKYSEWGSVFMDYKNTLSDDNLIIYGHHDTGSARGLSKLENLLHADMYETNKNLTLILENEQREYTIVAVYVVNKSKAEELTGLRTKQIYDFNGERDEDFIDDYNEFLSTKRLYDTGETLQKGDNLLTLGTCVDYEGVNNNPDYFEIVVARETNRVQIEKGD